MPQVFSYWSHAPWRHPRPAAPEDDPGAGARWPFLAGPAAVVGLSLAAAGLAAAAIAASGLAAPTAVAPPAATGGGAPAGPDRVAIQHAAVRLAALACALVVLRIAGRSRDGLAVLAAIVAAGLAAGEGLLRVDAVRAVCLIDPPGAAALLGPVGAARLAAAAETSFRIVVVAGWLATLGYALLALPSRRGGLDPARRAEKRRLLAALTAATAVLFASACAGAWLGTVAQVLDAAPSAEAAAPVAALARARLLALAVALAAIHLALAAPALAVRAADGVRASAGSGRRAIVLQGAACALPVVVAVALAPLAPG